MRWGRLFWKRSCLSSSCKSSQIIVMVFALGWEEFILFYSFALRPALEAWVFLQPSLCGALEAWAVGERSSVLFEATNWVRPFKWKFSKNSMRFKKKNHFLSHTRHISSAHSSQEAGGHHIGQGRWEASPSSETVLGDVWPVEWVIGWSLGVSFLGFHKPQNFNYSLASPKLSVCRNKKIHGSGDEGHWFLWL